MNKHNDNLKYRLDKATGEFIPSELRLGDSYHIANIRHKTPNHYSKRSLGFNFVTHN